MAPKPATAVGIILAAMAMTILTAMTWAAALPIFHHQLLLVY
jgi:hypothetical protein